MFKIGQKVVCINANNGQLLVENEIYTVAGYSNYHPKGLMLKEISSNPVHVGFWEHRFRAIDDTWVEKLLCKLLEEIETGELVSA